MYEATPHAGSYLLMQENLNDLTHLAYLHKDSFAMHYLTPETKTMSHYYWSITNNFNIDSDEYYEGTKAIASIGFAEDKWASEQMQTLLEDDHIEYKEVNIAGDKVGLLFRGVMLNWVLEEYVS